MLNGVRQMRRKENEKGEKKEKINFSERTKKEQVMEKYKCSVCGYIYDPAVGDESQGIPTGTPFAELPDSWVCPECGVGKEMFEKL